MSFGVHDEPGRRYGRGPRSAVMALCPDVLRRDEDTLEVDVKSDSCVRVVVLSRTLGRGEYDCQHTGKDDLEGQTRGALSDLRARCCRCYYSACLYALIQADRYNIGACLGLLTGAVVFRIETFLLSRRCREPLLTVFSLSPMLVFGLAYVSYDFNRYSFGAFLGLVTGAVVFRIEMLLLDRGKSAAPQS